MNGLQEVCGMIRIRKRYWANNLQTFPKFWKNTIYGSSDLCILKMDLRKSLVTSRTVQKQALTQPSNVEEISLDS